MSASIGIALKAADLCSELEINIGSVLGATNPRLRLLEGPVSLVLDTYWESFKGLGSCIAYATNMSGHGCIHYDDYQQKTTQLQQGCMITEKITTRFLRHFSTRFLSNLEEPNICMNWCCFRTSNHRNDYSLAIPRYTYRGYACPWCIRVQHRQAKHLQHWCPSENPART